MILVIGASGVLGTEICRRARGKQQAVRALVRKTTAPDRIAQLKAAGVELVEGDLKDVASLERACARVDQVISTASSTQSRAEGDSIETVDLQGQLSLVSAAEKARVKQLVFVSFPSAGLEFPLQSAKRAVEARLRTSSVRHTILQPPHFFEVWFSAGLGFDVREARARFFGNGTAKLNFVSFYDVAEVAVQVTGLAAAEQKTLAFGGPEALSQRDVVAIFEHLTGKTFATESMPVEALQGMLNDGDPLTRSFGALMLLCGAREDYRVDQSSLEGLVSLRWKTAREFAESAIRG